MALIAFGATLIVRAGDASNVLLTKFEPPPLLTGTIYDATSTNILFEFKRIATQDGTNLIVLREFTAPDGTLAARETVVYAGEKLVSLTLDESQTGASGSAQIVRDSRNSPTGKIKFTYQAKTGKVEKATEALRPNTLTGDMVGPFLSDHWDDLRRGHEVKCRYLVVPRKETVGFSFSKTAETTWQGKPAVVVRMTPTSMIVGLIVDPLYFTLEKDAPHRVLQYTGRTTPKLKTKSGWKDLDGVTILNWE